jgi:hypothetical protein
VIWPRRGRRFEVDEEEVERARLLLGISKRVLVKKVWMWHSEGGYIREEPELHVVTVRSRQSWRQASKTIWHELEHVVHAQELGGYEAWAAQVKREWRAAQRQSRRKFVVGSRAYRRMPNERRAIVAEKRHRTCWPLARGS